VKVAAYQAPLLPSGTMPTERIAEQVRACEAAGIDILCCPEAVLGGLADDAREPADFAIDVASGQLDAVLRPLASATVTTIVGFTERRGGRLFNSAAVVHAGAVHGIYRKHHPAIHHSVYDAGVDAPVFTAGGLTFGVVICRDSNYEEPALTMVQRGARCLFIPTNNALPPEKGGSDVIEDARRADIARAIENQVWVVRADVAGRAGALTCHGSSAIVDRHGTVLTTAPRFEESLIVATIEPSPVRTMDIDDLGARFEACAIPKEEWTHATHLVVGLWHVHRYGAEDALVRLRSGIRRLNESHGGRNTETDGYHETITAAYVRLLAQYLDRCHTDRSLSERASHLLDSPLAGKDALFTFYSRERLMSTIARAEWVEPDIAPIDARAILAAVRT
jgi:predicted amidohydrolase